MDDPNKEEDRMDYYSDLTDIFFDLHYENLSSEEIIKEVWPCFKGLKKSLGSENLLKMLNAFKISVLDPVLEKENNVSMKNSVFNKLEQIRNFIKEE